MNKRKWTDKQFIEAVKNSLSYAQVLRLLKLKPAGGNYNTVKRKIKELNIDTSHMTGATWNIGSRFRIIKSAQPLNKILVKHSTFSSTYKLKNRLLKENIKNTDVSIASYKNGVINPYRLNYITLMVLKTI